MEAASNAAKLHPAEKQAHENGVLAKAEAIKVLTQLSESSMSICQR
jgi:hypothetical protein